MFFTSLYVGKMDNRRVRESAPKNKTRKRLFSLLLAPKKKRIFEPLQIFVKDEPAGSRGEEDKATWHLINKANKHATQCLSELNKTQDFHMASFVGKAFSTIFVKRDKQQRLCCSLFWRFHSYLIVIEAIYKPSSGSFHEMAYEVEKGIVGHFLSKGSWKSLELTWPEASSVPSQVFSSSQAF